MAWISSDLFFSVFLSWLLCCCMFTIKTIFINHSGNFNIISLDILSLFSRIVIAAFLLLLTGVTFLDFSLSPITLVLSWALSYLLSSLVGSLILSMMMCLKMNSFTLQTLIIVCFTPVYSLSLIIKWVISDSRWLVPPVFNGFSHSSFNRLYSCSIIFPLMSCPVLLSWIYSIVIEDLTNLNLERGRW